MKKKVILIGVITLVLVGAITLIRNTLAVDNSSDVETYNIVLNNDNNTTVTVPANSTKTVIYKIHNDNNGTVSYAIGYNSDTSVVVEVYQDSEDNVTGLMEKNSYKFIKLALVNKANTDSTITLSTILGYEHGGDLIFPENVLIIKRFYPIIPYISEYITNLYMKAAKATTINGSVTYNYANIYDSDDDEDTSGGLMNDRLGGTTTSLDGGNIRYYGANPSNYIYFNCDNYADQSDRTCEKWRIIGVFGNKVKIVKNELLKDIEGNNATLAYDQQKNININSTAYSNDWHQASLQEFLNGVYYDSSEYLGPKDITNYPYYNGATGNSSVTLNLEQIGIKNLATRNKIAESTWNLSGFISNGIYSNQAYISERGEDKCSDCTYDTTWIGKIALLYASDYGYAVDFTKCSSVMRNYGSDGCKLNNYLNKGNPYWVISSYTGSNNKMNWYISYGNSVGLFITNVQIDYTQAKVLPALFLNDEETIKDGDGTSNNPYQLRA